MPWRSLSRDVEATAKAFFIFNYPFRSSTWSLFSPSYRSCWQRGGRVDRGRGEKEARWGEVRLLRQLGAGLGAAARRW